MNNKAAEHHIFVVVSKLNRDYSIFVEVKIKDTRSTYHKKCMKTLQHSIIFGMKNLADHFKFGYKEYRSIQYVWGRNSHPTGLNAIHNMVLHEYAHVLQTDRYERRSGSVHNHEFVGCLYELIKKYSYYEKSEYPQINNARSRLNKMLARR